jgi:hypothetical protein
MGTALSLAVRPRAVPALRLKLSAPGWKVSVERLDLQILEPNVHREPLMQLQSQATACRAAGLPSTRSVMMWPLML